MKIKEYKKLDSGLEYLVLEDDSKWVFQISYTRFSMVHGHKILQRCADLPCLNVANFDSLSYVPQDSLIKTNIYLGGPNFRYCVLIPESIILDWLLVDIQSNPQLLKVSNFF